MRYYCRNGTGRKENTMNNVYDESKNGFAERNYQRLCATLEKMQWKFKREDSRREIVTDAIGDGLTIALRFYVNAERQLMYVKSPMPYQIEQTARDVVGQAVNIANYSMLNGCFEYDADRGYLAFRMVVPFDKCELSEEICKYLVLLTCQMVDKYNGKFFSLSKGEITLEQFKQATQG